MLTCSTFCAFFISSLSSLALPFSPYSPFLQQGRKISSSYNHLKTSGLQSAVWKRLRLSSVCCKDLEICGQADLGLDATLSLSNHVALGKSLNLLETQFSYL